MSRTVRITPAGRLVVEPAPDEQPQLPEALSDDELLRFVSLDLNRATADE